SSAVPRLPFVASGMLGHAQRAALARALAHPGVRKRTPVLLMHHPLHNPVSRIKTLLEGLADADELRELLMPVAKGLVLHGHLHRRLVRRLDTSGGGHLLAIGATSASLHHELETRMSG